MSLAVPAFRPSSLLLSRPHRVLRQLPPLGSFARPSSSSSSSPSSSSPSRPSASRSHYSRSEFKVFPFLVLFVIGSGSYVLLVKSRTGARKPDSSPRSPDS
ncbi:hypothetical protein P168DRAFT_321703 [Aspergillus campestris IBT 28561]|uniref:Transmembrane protein n=1 Tax=Aspergillus campestris (strain IBT 28561) TaxID=1392248 RepID=A0A2I1CUK1_ASPC2|nr:uncharacterized protein P168DRAFT_321703 [Aspergillus campestris IBT 28561]PKY01291.1 hypothetical protein P168DRAFT_321703 [Aspergillus campestris IBT 28561]